MMENNLFHDILRRPDSTSSEIAQQLLERLFNIVQVNEDDLDLDMDVEGEDGE